MVFLMLSVDSLIADAMGLVYGLGVFEERGESRFEFDSASGDDYKIKLHASFGFSSDCTCARRETKSNH